MSVDEGVSDEQKALAMNNRKYSTAEIVDRGEEIYASEIQAEVEDQHKGRFLALDIETHQYEIDDDMLTALDRAKARHAGAALYVVRIGYPSAVNLGGVGKLAQ